ncbi:MAG: hypothetical protein KDB84_01695 [Flavobacteriales bacterium]|nr:hypothetical protein [Flavobacteriales bacterium]
MNTNWAKVLLFSLIGFALGFLVCRTTCNSGRDRGACEREHHGGHAACAKGDGRSCCQAGPGKAMEHPGDAQADAIVKDLEKAGFMGDTTIAIHGGKVRVVRSTDNLSVHVDMEGEAVEKDVEVIHGK